MGSIATLAIGGVGLYLYDRHQKKLALANESAEILEANIKAYDAAQAEMVPEVDGKEEPHVRVEGREGEVAEEQ